MKTKLFFTVAALLASVTMMGAVGPQSMNATFGTDGNAEGWSITKQTGAGQTTGTIVVSGGKANVTMGVQKESDNKYRADFSYTDESFTFDKTKDYIWAIKLMAAVPGTGSNKKLRIHYENNASGYTEGGQINTATLNCADGGVIYYANISSYSDVKVGGAKIKYITFVIADAVIANSEDAHYSVDWVASFSSVEELTAYQKNEERSDFTEPYLEVLYRIQSGAYSNDYPKQGFAVEEMEGTYSAGLFAVEYFLIENFNSSKTYALKLTNTQTVNKDSIAVWNFPFQTNTLTSASFMSAKADSIIGFAPGGSGTINAPLAEAEIAGSTWTLTIPGASLTQLATIDSKTLVGLLVTNRYCATKDKKAKFASVSNTTKAHPTLISYKAQIGTNLYETFDAAVAAVNDAETITLLDDATMSAQVRKDSKNITIEGNDYTLSNTYTTGHPFLTYSGSITVQNMTIDGGDIVAKNLAEVGGATFTANNVTFKNTTSSNTLGIICLKGSGTLQLTDVTFDNCTNTGTNTPLLFIGNDNGTVSNTLTYTNCTGTEIYVEADRHIRVSSLTSNLNLTFASNRTEGKAAVLGTTDLEKFTVTNSDWELYVSSDELKARKTGATALDNTDADAKAVKVLRNGQVLILRDGRTYNMMGVEVK